MWVFYGGERMENCRDGSKYLDFKKNVCIFKGKQYMQYLIFHAVPLMSKEKPSIGSEANVSTSKYNW